MSIDAARAFNRTCPPDAVVEVAMRDGTTRSGRLQAPAFVWAGLPLPSFWTVDAVRPKLLPLPTAKS